MAQQRKSLRRKSLRHKNRTTLKRGGVIEKKRKIPDYFTGKKPDQSIISKNNIQTPRVFYKVSDLTADMTEKQNARKPTPPRDFQFPDIQATMSEEQKAKIQKEIDARIAAYLKSNRFQDSNSYPPVKRVTRNV